MHALPALGGSARLIAADCVEYNPTRDVNSVTAMRMVAAKVAKREGELAGLLEMLIDKKN